MRINTLLVFCICAWNSIWNFAENPVNELPLVTTKKLAESGNPDAQVKLGLNYQQSHNFTAAESWFKKAVVLGHAEALVCLGDLYSSERINIGSSGKVPRKPQTAVALYEIAALQGHKRGQLNLGLRISDGVGTATNDLQAYVWLRRAGDKSVGKVYLDRLVLRMPTAQINEADKMVSGFIPLSPSEAIAEFAFKRLKPLAVVGTGKERSVFFYEGGFDESEEKILEFQGLPLSVKCISIQKSSVVMEVMNHRRELHLHRPNRKK